MSSAISDVLSEDLDGRLLRAFDVAHEPLRNDRAQPDRQVGQNGGARIVGNMLMIRDSA